MRVDNVRKHLRQASEEVTSACEEPAPAEVEEYLAGIATQLNYYVEGDTTDPEAHIYPPPGALDTIQHRLTEVIEETDGPAADHLQNARHKLLQVIMALDDRMNEGRPSSDGR